MSEVLTIKGGWKKEPLEKGILEESMGKHIPHTYTLLKKHDRGGFHSETKKELEYQGETMRRGLGDALRAITLIGAEIQRCRLKASPIFAELFDSKEARMRTVSATIIHQGPAQFGFLMEELANNHVSMNCGLDIEAVAVGDQNLLTVEVQTHRMIETFHDFVDRILQDATGAKGIGWIEKESAY